MEGCVGFCVKIETLRKFEVVKGMAGYRKYVYTARKGKCSKLRTRER